MTYTDDLTELGRRADADLGSLRADVDAATGRATAAESAAAAAVADRDAARAALADLQVKYDALVKVNTPVDPIVKIAVIPDTQQEVLTDTDTRLADRFRWIVANGYLRVIQTGDFLNWNTTDHVQAQRAAKAAQVLEDAHLPYQICIGNHDTYATGPGGAARTGGKAWVDVRNTTELNAYFNEKDFGDVDGRFEDGKIDNTYSTWEQGGKKWLSVTLEFCPRKAAVDWAVKVLAQFPDHNAIVSTHYFLTAAGSIGQGNEGYGDQSPQKIWDAIKTAPNLRLIFCGHVGSASKFTQLAGAGGTVYAGLGTFHSNTENPTRLITIDTAKGTLSSTFYAPSNGKKWPEFDETNLPLALV